MIAEEAQPHTLEEQSPMYIVAGVLGHLESQEEVAESESDRDKAGSNDVPATITKKNMGEDDCIISQSSRSL